MSAISGLSGHRTVNYSLFGRPMFVVSGRSYQRMAVQVLSGEPPAYVTIGYEYFIDGVEVDIDTFVDRLSDETLG